MRVPCLRQRDGVLAPWKSALALVLLAAVDPLASAQRTLELNGPLAVELRTGDVSQHLLTASGTRYLYRADRSANGTFELFSVPADGSGPSVRVSPPLVPGGNTGIVFGLGAGDRVAFTATATSAGVFELHSAPADGSAPAIRLTPPGTSVTALWVPPGGDQLFYRDSGSFALHTVPLDGSAPASTFEAGTVLNAFFSPDRATVVFLTLGGLDRYRLHSAPADGSAAPVLLRESITSAVFTSVAFAADGTHLVFEEADPEGQFFHNLFAVPLDGSQAAVQLNQGAFVDTWGHALGADPLAGRLAYLQANVISSIAFDGSQRLSLTPAGWNAIFEPFAETALLVNGSDVFFAAESAGNLSILRAPLDGSQLGTPLFPAAPYSFIGALEVFGSTLVFSAGSGSASGLYAVPLAGGTPVTLAPPLFPFRGVRSFRTHPSAQVVFTSNQETSTKDELYVVPLDGSVPPLKLNTPLIPAGNVTAFSFPADGQSVVYLADPLVDRLDGLFRAPLSGLGPVQQLNEPLLGTAIGGDVLEYATDPDGKRVFYRADAHEDERFELFTVGTRGGLPVSLTTALPAEASVQAGFALTPDAQTAVLVAKEPGGFTLYAVSTTPGPLPIALDASAEIPQPLRITADGSRVVYRVRGVASGDFALRSAVLDGTSPPVELHPGLSAGQSVLDFAVAAQGSAVAYRADARMDNSFELFAVPADGSLAPVPLHEPLSLGRVVSAYRIAPDGERIVFLSNPTLGTRFDLFSVPSEGGRAPRRLDPALPDDRRVLDFAISPDATTVVYRANPRGSTQYDLYSVPIDGPLPAHGTLTGQRRHGPVRLLTRFPSARAAEPDYAFDASGTEVLLRARTLNNFKYELFRVPVDASSVPLRLSAALTSSQSVDAFALSADQDRVVYRADAVLDDVFELFSVPFAGGAATRLDPLPAFADVSAFQIDVAAGRVVYRADRDVDGRIELYEVPLDGSAGARRLNGTLPAGGNVEPDVTVLPAGRTLYRADQRENDVFGLFVTLDRPVLPR